MNRNDIGRKAVLQCGSIWEFRRVASLSSGNAVRHQNLVSVTPKTIATDADLLFMTTMTLKTDVFFFSFFFWRHEHSTLTSSSSDVKETEDCHRLLLIDIKGHWTMTSSYSDVKVSEQLWHRLLLSSRTSKSSIVIGSFSPLKTQTSVMPRLKSKSKRRLCDVSCSFWREGQYRTDRFYHRLISYYLNRNQECSVPVMLTVRWLCSYVISLQWRHVCVSRALELSSCSIVGARIEYLYCTRGLL